MTYSEKLKSPKWQKKRLKILERDNWLCTQCKKDDLTLHVHHKSYHGKNPWDTPDEYLITMCEVCHDFEEWIKVNSPLIYENAKYANETCIFMWRLISCQAFVIANDPMLFARIKDLMNDVIDRKKEEYGEHLKSTLNGLK